MFIDLIFTKSNAEANRWASGTDPGGQVSNKNDNLNIPLNTGVVDTSFRSLKTMNSDSLDDSPNSTEFFLLKSKIKTKHSI